MSSYLQYKTSYWAPNTYTPDGSQYLDHPRIKQTQGRSYPTWGLLFLLLSLPLSPQLLPPVFSITVTAATSCPVPRARVRTESCFSSSSHSSPLLHLAYSIHFVSLGSLAPILPLLWMWLSFSGRKGESDILTGVLGVFSFPFPCPAPLPTSPTYIY